MKSWMAVLVFSILNNARPSVSVRGVCVCVRGVCVCVCEVCVCVSISEQLTSLLINQPFHA